jgi:hypothetical protein
MANTITKAQLEAQVTELQEALAAAQARTTDLEQQLESQAAEAQEPERRDQLQQVVWLQREAPSFERNTMRWSADGETLIMRLGVQYATIDRRSGQRLFGERKWLTAIGDIAEAVRNLYETSDTRLVRIGAYERPQPPAQDGTRRSEWILASFEPMPRLDAPAQPVQAAASAPLAEPTSEEIPF